jgi:hypothetical protein
MHHKRGRAKNQRSGCLMCKSNKANGARKLELGHGGFGKLRDTIHAIYDMVEYRKTGD